MLEYFVSIAAAVTVGLLQFPYSRYHYYFRWVTTRAYVAWFFSAIVLNGVAGVLGTFIAHTIPLTPHTPHWVSGALYGVFGASLVRVSLTTIPGTEDAELLSLLSVATKWVQGFVDTRLEETVSRRLKDLKVGPLGSYTLEIFKEKVDEDSELSGEIRRTLLAEITALMDTLDTKKPDTREHGTATVNLRVLCKRWILKYRVSPPDEGL